MMKTTDPMEQHIEFALREIYEPFETDIGGGNEAGLDFYLPSKGVHIEVKRFHSPRIAEQMSRADNVIVAQGEEAVRYLAYLIRSSHGALYGPVDSEAGNAPEQGPKLKGGVM